MIVNRAARFVYLFILFISFSHAATTSPPRCKPSLEESPKFIGIEKVLPETFDPFLDDLSLPPLYETASIELKKTVNAVDKDKLHTTIFIVGKNSGMSLRAVQILMVLKAPHVYWAFGEGLRKAPPSLKEHFGDLTKIKEVVFFNFTNPDFTRAFEEERKSAISIDTASYHHFGVIRRKAGSDERRWPLQQLTDALGLELGPLDILLEAYEMSGMRGLLQHFRPSVLNNAQREALIDQILDFSMIAKGYTLEQLQAGRGRVRALGPLFEAQRLHYPRRPLFMIDFRYQEGAKDLDPTILREQILAKYPNGNLLTIQWSGFSFIGAGNVRDALLKAFDPQARGYELPYRYVSGGDPRTTAYLHFRTKTGPVVGGRRTPRGDLKREIFKLARDLVRKPAPK